MTAPPAPDAAPARALRQAAADFWLRLFFRHAPRFAGVLRRFEPFLCGGAFRCSRVIRTATTANARRALGPGATDAEVEAVARRQVKSFFRFCCDVGESANCSAADLLGRVGEVVGEHHYRAARRADRGVIVVTAHMGSFEVGLAALKQHERTIHVVFRRDTGAFEQSRAALRQRLGVIEAPVDEGWTVWLRLREALLRGEAVVLQGDRVMPGQKGQPVPFLGGRILLPTGPVKLAMATGAQIVPVFSIRAEDGTLRVIIEPSIEVDSNTSGAGEGGIHPALLKWAQVLERFVRTYPDQWLMFQPAVEDDKVNG